VIAIYCPQLKHAKKPIIDFKGAALIAVGLATLVLAIDNTEIIFADFMHSTGITLVGLRVIMLIIVVAATALFITVERRAKEPILPMYFFENRNYVLIMIIAVLFGSAFMGSILYITQFNQQVFGASPTQSGLMLLPMVGGLMFASIGSGQIISRTGRYKIFMQIGFTMATVSVLFLLALKPESGYVYEAFVMVFLGMGMGVAMPVINLAVQNEFEMHDLGAATSSSQLFRSLGSTVGIALFSSILTAGIASGITSMSNTPYVQTLKQNPVASKMGDFNDFSTLLTLNMPDVKQKINDQSAIAFAKLPEPIKTQVSTKFDSEQSDFSNIVVHTFSDGMHNVFIVSAILMASATAFVFVLKEKPLRSAKPTATPGEM